MSAGQQSLKAHGLLGRDPSLLGDAEIILRVDHHTVEPVDGAELAYAAENSNIWTVDFGQNFRDLVFHEAIEIGRPGRLFVHSHYSSPGILREAVVYDNGHTPTFVKSQSGRTTTGKIPLSADAPRFQSQEPCS